MKQFRSKSLAKTGLIVLAAGALVFVTYGGQAYARDGQVNAEQSTTTTGQTGNSTTQVEAKTTDNEVQASPETETQTESAINSRIEKAQQELKAKRDQAKSRLEAARLKVCEARQQGITQHMSSMVTTSTNHLNVFSDIASRVEAFYASKGKTVANYDTLVADVNAKKTAAETAIATAKASSTSFSCADANPQLAGQQFKDAHAAVIKALQDYRTAIKNLIVAVRSAQANATTSTTTDSSNTTSTTTQTTGSNQ